MKHFSILVATTFSMALLLALPVAAKRFSLPNRAMQEAPAGTVAADPITGEWNVTFHVGKHTTPGAFNLKLEGKTVTGTVVSQHTGPGTIRDGSWSDDKLSLTLEFQKHESISVTGVLIDGKLTGEFQTEGFTDKWEAIRK